MISGRLIVPFVPTPETVVQRMLTLADVKPGEFVYDLGAGDGRIISSAVRNFGAKALGVELNPSRYAEILDRLTKERIRESASVIRGDFLDVNLGPADVVTLYLLTSVNSSIRPKLERELRSGSRVVSHDFPIRGWVPTQTETVKDQYNTHEIYVYRVPSSIPALPTDGNGVEPTFA
ncbi:MAG: class I SAM-dependent methyltransferase [Candidatus Bathyarchaeia archaeon]|jgi:tRNA G37 N-methylase Trm5